MAKKAHSIGKKAAKKRSFKKKTKPTEVVYHSTKEIKVERALIDNFIGLQKVMVNLSARFDSLSDQISKLLELFEISARSLAKKEVSSTGDSEARKVLEKLDNISMQAGLIGKGLALIHEVGTETQNPVIPMNLRQNKPMVQTPVVQEKQENLNQVPGRVPQNAVKPVPKGITQPSGIKGFQKSMDTDGEKEEGIHPPSG